MTTVDKINAFENGEMGVEETIDFFAEIIKSGLVWQLQGTYQRTACSFINAGHISPKGAVLSYPEEG
jgi:hypothetical protein